MTIACFLPSPIKKGLTTSYCDRMCPPRNFKIYKLEMVSYIIATVLLSEIFCYFLFLDTRLKLMSLGYYSHVHKIVRSFDGGTNFPFPTSEAKGDY